MPTSTHPIPIVRHIAGISAGRAAWLLDIWGVLHNGVAPFEGAVAACRTFRAEGGTVLLVSNAPRPAASVAQQLDRIGVDRLAYDGIVSSGDTARAMIAALGDAPVYHIGPERDLVLFEALAVRRVGPEQAASVVCTGLVDDETETPETYADLLGVLVGRRLPMICANPDIKVERGSRSVYCAGAIAQAYGRLGGDVRYAGKPYLPIYERAFARLAELRGERVASAQVLAIGDGATTDIAGAHAAGIDSVYVASAVNLGPGGRLEPEALERLFAPGGARPVAAMPALVW